MLSKKVFWDWFKAEVQGRWKVCHFEWTEIGDWHWRLRDFGIDTLSQAVRQHKVCEDYRSPSLKKVYEYARKINADNTPKSKRDHNSNHIPDAHTYIMCVAKGDNGCGCVGWFVPVLIWPFHKTYTAEDYRRIAEQQRLMHSRNGRAGVWKIFTNTTHGEMMDRRMKLCNEKPLDLNKLRKWYKDRL